MKPGRILYAAILLVLGCAAANAQSLDKLAFATNWLAEGDLLERLRADVHGAKREDHDGDG